MRHVFIADAHLRDPADANYQKLLDFLAGLPGTTDTLFILGDLFEFWIGHRTVPYPHYRPVLDRLRMLRDAGVGIVYFEGNHDFHLGRFFEDTLGAVVYPSPAILELDGKRLCLCHGDQMNSRDYGYRLLRFVFHSRLTKMLALMVPPSIPSAIARSMGRASRSKHDRRRARWDYRAIAREFAARQFAAGCDAVVTGHIHTPFLEHSSDNPERILVSLGDWITHFSYAEWENGEIRLKFLDR